MLFLKRFILFFSIFYIIANTNGESSSTRGNSKPNIVILLADDLGYGDVSHHPTSSTPFLNKIIPKSKFFSNFYVASPVCSPSRAALLTGSYPVRTGIWPSVFFSESVGGLNTSIPTLSSELKSKHNYRTGIVGKWHLGVGKNNEYLPIHHGFDHYYGIPYSQDMCPCLTCFPYDEPCLSKCDPTAVSCPVFLNDQIVEQPANLSILTSKYNHHAIKFIKETADDEPFFLYYAFHQTHHPQFASLGYRNQTLRGSFGDALLEMDSSIEKIFHALEETNKLDNTVIFFTSDNGPSLTRHERGGCAGLFRCGKGTTYEGGMHVPAFMHYQSKIQPGISESLITSLDIFPTMMSFVRNDGEIKNYSDGYDFSQYLLNHNSNQSSPRKSFLYYPMREHPNIGPYAYRYNNFKAHFITQGNGLSDNDNYDLSCRVTAKMEKHNPPLLFNLNQDPSERYPLQKDIEYQSLLKEISANFEHDKSQVHWAESEINKGNDPAAAPCCNKNCKPFPRCCDCANKPKPSINVIV